MSNAQGIATLFAYDVVVAVLLNWGFHLFLFPILYVCDAVTAGAGLVDRVACGARHQLPFHPNVPEAALHQHHPDLLQLLPQHHLSEGMNEQTRRYDSTGPPKERFLLFSLCFARLCPGVERYTDEKAPSSGVACALDPRFAEETALKARWATCGAHMPPRYSRHPAFFKSV